MIRRSSNLKFSGEITIFLVVAASSLAFAQKNKPYKEDLSRLHPAIEKEVITSRDSVIDVKPITPVKMVNFKIDPILDSLDRFNLMNKFVDGFTIQIYSGQKRDEALKIKKKVVDDLPTYTANLIYQQPKFRVTIGKYFSRLEAQHDLLTIKRSITAAILVPEKIQIK